MRILYVTNKFPSRSETFIATKILGMASRGNKILVCCSSYHPEEMKSAPSDNISILLLNKKTLIRYAILHPKESYFHFSKKLKISASFLIHHARRFKPDITHFVFSGLGVLYLDTILQIPGKKIVSCRGSGEKMMPLMQSDRSEKMNILFDRVDAVHCVSEDMKRTILPYCSNQQKIFIQYTGINTSLFVPESIKKQNQLFTIVSVGRLSLQKGYITGMHIMYKLKKDNRSFKWVIIGDGPQKREIKYHCHFMNLDNVIEFAGAKNQSEIIEAYKTADVFFLPSIYEGVSNAAIEAMCMKLPVVSSKSGGIQEVIENGNNGFLAEVGDIETMYQQIKKIMDDKALRNEIGEKAHNSVVNRFTSENYLNGFEKNYLKLLEKE